jgi:EVE domain
MTGAAMQAALFDTPPSLVKTKARATPPADGVRANWIAVASAEHARRGRDACTDSQSGFMQVNHGKRAPLMRVHPGDRVAYYSPSVAMGGTDKLQSFVSIGIVQSAAPYTFDMGGGFVPFRRDVKYVKADEAPIAPLLDDFEFVEDRQRWGYKFRFGLFKVSDHDMQLIANAMHAPVDSLHF